MGVSVSLAGRGLQGFRGGGDPEGLGPGRLLGVSWGVLGDPGGSYSALTSACEKGALPQRALQLSETMLQQGLLPNGITYSALISACEKGAVPQRALELFETMLHQGLLPGSFYSAEDWVNYSIHGPPNPKCRILGSEWPRDPNSQILRVRFMKNRPGDRSGDLNRTDLRPYVGLAHVCSSLPREE